MWNPSGVLFTFISHKGRSMPSGWISTAVGVRRQQFVVSVVHDVLGEKTAPRPGLGCGTDHWPPLLGETCEMLFKAVDLEKHRPVH